MRVPFNPTKAPPMTYLIVKGRKSHIVNHQNTAKTWCGKVIGEQKITTERSGELCSNCTYHRARSKMVGLPCSFRLRGGQCPTCLEDAPGRKVCGRVWYRDEEDDDYWNRLNALLPLLERNIENEVWRLP